MPPKPDRPVIVIVGGGFSGTALAFQLARKAYIGRRAQICVFEPRRQLGAGLAYSTNEPSHRINVPAGKMSLDPGDPDSFVRFIARTDPLKGDINAYGDDGLAYPRRAVFGNYVAAEIAPYLASGDVEHRQVEVTGVEKNGSRWDVLSADGQVLTADVVVLAASHPAPALPQVAAAIRHHPKLIADVTLPGALDVIAASDRILIIGNGLTSADVVAALDERGHHGAITSISRRGLRSRGHATLVQEPFGDFVSHPSIRASHLLHRVRSAVRLAAMQGLSWHAVLDAVRVQGQQIWQFLPVAERRRVARWLRPYWDVHRFRIAPQVQKALDQGVASGQLDISAASVKSLALTGSGIAVALRGKRPAETNHMVVDAVVVTTGPAHGGILNSQAFLSQLETAGYLSACPTGLGIACNLKAEAVGVNAEPVAGLFIVGPLARGAFGELMGLPQVSEHAVLVAQQVEHYLALESSAAALSKAG